MIGPTIVVETIGSRPTVLKVGEQFAWLSAAFRSSNDDHCVSLARPHLGHITTSTLKDNINAMSCTINATVQKVERTTASLGRCWFDLFRNPVIAVGFPIRRRPGAQTGLEITLALMARLIGTKRLNEFIGIVFIKGFSSMLYPTRTLGDCLVWHHDFNENGDRISYLERSSPALKGISFGNVESARHIIGWCTKVENYAGMFANSILLRKLHFLGDKVSKIMLQVQQISLTGELPPHGWPHLVQVCSWKNSTLLAANSLMLVSALQSGSKTSLFVFHRVAMLAD